jgi:hypothetical protein
MESCWKSWIKKLKKPWLNPHKAANWSSTWTSPSRWIYIFQSHNPNHGEFVKQRNYVEGKNKKFPTVLWMKANHFNSRYPWTNWHNDDHLSSKTHIHQLQLSNPVFMAKGLSFIKKVKAKQGTLSDPIHRVNSLHTRRIAWRKRLSFLCGISCYH